MRKRLYSYHTADAILEFPEDSFDFVLIDGRARVECAYNALSRVRPGGFLLLDNSEWEKYAPIFAAAAGWTRLDFENGVWRTSTTARARGDAQTTAFDYELAKDSLPGKPGDKGPVE